MAQLLNKMAQQNSLTKLLNKIAKKMAKKVAQQNGSTIWLSKIA